VGVDPVRSTCDQGHQVLAVRDIQQLCLLRQNHTDPVDFIGIDISQHMEEKFIPFRQKVQIRKKARLLQSPMSGQNSMCGFSAYRQRSTFYMPHSPLQGCRPGTMKDDKVLLYFRDLQIAHHAIPARIQKAVIGVGADIAPVTVKSICDRIKEMLSVISPGVLQDPFSPVLLHLRSSLLIGCDALSGDKAVPGCTGSRIQQDPSGYGKQGNDQRPV